MLVIECEAVFTKVDLSWIIASMYHSYEYILTIKARVVSIK